MGEKPDIKTFVKKENRGFQPKFAAVFSVDVDKEIE